MNVKDRWHSAISLKLKLLFATSDRKYCRQKIFMEVRIKVGPSLSEPTKFDKFAPITF
jgi:hypothetical protein